MRRLRTGCRDGHTVRRGTFRYDLSLPNRQWLLTLWLAEPDSAAARGFSVVAQGNDVISDLDVARAAGGADRVLRRTIPIRVRDGRLRRVFRAGNGPALLSALRVVPDGDTAAARPNTPYQPDGISTR